MNILGPRPRPESARVSFFRKINETRVSWVQTGPLRNLPSTSLSL